MVVGNGWVMDSVIVSLYQIKVYSLYIERCEMFLLRIFLSSLKPAPRNYAIIRGTGPLRYVSVLKLELLV
jgi:hypothetical protein